LGLIEQLGIDPKLIVINILGFIVLLIILKKYMYGPITGLLAQRAEDIRSTYDAAEQEKSAAEQFRLEYEKRIAQVETEAHEKIQASIKEAHGIRDEIVNEARAKAELALARGLDELAREREKTVVALREEVADLVIGATSRILEQTIDEKTHRKLVDDFISGVGKKN
jgi:F-type H+-transporting ATPase subunit b